MRLAAVALVLALGAGACGERGPQLVDFSDTRRNYRPEDYPAVLKTWTRHAKVVSDVGTVIELWGTYKSWSFRQAFIEEYARVYGVQDAERDALYGAQLEGARKTYEFHVVAQSTEWRWNDLDKDRSAWRISLVDGAGHEIRPRERGVNVDRLPGPVEERFFPFRTPFSRTYSIVFDRNDGDRDAFAGTVTGRIILRVAGPLGRADLVWQSR